LSEASEIFVALFKSGPSLIRLTLSLGWMYVTLGLRVRSTRRAFEKELIRIGMSREDARRLSVAFEELKNNVQGMLKSGAFSVSRRASGL
jgi:hypothetical protein